MTTTLQVWTGAYPSIVNPIQVRVYYESDPLAIVTSQTHAAPHNDQETWSFPGLDRVNILFRVYEVDGSGNIIQQLGKDMNVVPGAYSQVTARAPEQITADTTTGFSSGVNTVVFDGTGGKEDWRGFDIGTLNRMGGEGVMKKGVEYSWNPNTGTLQLLTAGDLFNPGEWFNVSFVLQVTQQTSSPPASYPAFATPKVITANYPVDAGADFGGGLIIRPAGTYLEVTFPAIASVPANKRIKIEFDPGAIQQCAKLIFQPGEVLSWLQGNRNNLYICNLESLYIYPFVDTDAVKRWRVDCPFGNWLRIGEQVVDDNIAANVFNKQMLDGTALDNQQYARLYNDFVLNLPPAEVCNYDDWATGNNKYIYSLANSANPANNGKFHIPNRLNMFERITDGTRSPGNYGGPQLLGHSHYNGVADDKAPGAAGNVFVYGTTTAGMPGFANGQIQNGNPPGDTYQGLTSSTGGNDHCPANIAVRKWLLV